MIWKALLLSHPSACLRRLVLRDLLSPEADDQELKELTTLCRTDPIILPLLELQQNNGSWKTLDFTAASGHLVLNTALALYRLGYLGFGPDQTPVKKGAEFLFEHQKADGFWPLPGEKNDTLNGEGYSMIPLQTSLPLRGLAACGYARDPRSELAYEWLLEQRLDDGSWPTGLASGTYGKVAGYRRLPHSRWGCRSNTTAVLHCLALHPERRHSEAAQRGLDLLLGRETKEKNALGFEVSRLIGAEPFRGFLTSYARLDNALILDLAWRIGASKTDERVASLVRFLTDLQGPFGSWEYRSFPHVSPWLTFDLLRSLSRLQDTGPWLRSEPPLPFQAYPKRPKRF